MNPNSPRKISCFIAGMVSLAGLLIFIPVCLFLYPGYWWIPIPACILLSGLTYLFSLFYINRYIFKTFNPIYRTLFGIDYLKTGIRKSRDINALRAEVSREMEKWGREKSEEIDQLKQSEKYRKDFLGNVSHELKTPIFNIQGYILTLLDGGLEDPSINHLYLKRSERSINRMINIVEDLESISRLESGELKMELKDFNLIPLIQEVFELQEMIARQKAIRLIMDYPSSKPVLVYADRKRIMEALNNLVVNSIKYGKKKGRTIISLTEKEDLVYVQVSDNGLGMEEKELPRIFERFYRIDKSRSRDQGGTGLGLSIVKHIMEAHNQKITVRSVPDEGSTFTFSLKKSVR